MVIQRFTQFFGRTPPLVTEEAFTTFYSETHRHVFRYILAFLGQPTEAEDITAEAFLRAWRTRDDFMGDADAAMGWVITIARRIAIDRCRRQAPSSIASVPDDLVDPHPSAEDMVIHQQQLGAVLHQIQQLPLGQRDMVVLRYVLGWRVKRIAEHLDSPENTVSVNLRRALHRIQQGLIAQEVHP